MPNKLTTIPKPRRLKIYILWIKTDSLIASQFLVHNPALCLPILCVFLFKAFCLGMQIVASNVLWWVMSCCWSVWSNDKIEMLEGCLFLLRKSSLKHTMNTEGCFDPWNAMAIHVKRWKQLSCRYTHATSKYWNMHDAWLAKSSVSEYSLTLSWLSEASHLDHSSDWTVERGPLVINADNAK